MDISKVRSGIHRPTRVHKKKRRTDMNLLEDFNPDPQEDLKDQLAEATVLLRRTVAYIPTRNNALFFEVKKFLGELKEAV